MAAVGEFPVVTEEQAEKFVLSCLLKAGNAETREYGRRGYIEAGLDPYFHGNGKTGEIIVGGVARYWELQLDRMKRDGKDPSRYVDQIRERTRTMLEGASYYGLVEARLDAVLSGYSRAEPEIPVQQETARHEYEKYLEIFDDQISKRGVDSVGAARMTRGILLDSFAHRGIYNSDYGDPNRFRDYSHIFDQEHYGRIKEIDEIMRYCLREKGLTELENDRMIVAGYDFDKKGRGPIRSRNRNEKKIDLKPVISKVREVCSRALNWVWRR